jgi:LPS sulfotransferase NodH
MKYQNIFIIGSPRSGTTWLQILLGAHPKVASTVELTIFSHYIAPLINGWNKEKENIDKGRWEQGLPYIWSQEEFYVFLRSFVDKAYEKVLEKNPEATHILDKHPGYSKHVKLIQKFLPDAKFIHIIRDGRDVACSMMAARKNIGFGEGKIEGAAREWRDNVLASRIISNDIQKYYEIRYEHLLANPIQVLNNVFNFCGLEASDSQVKSIIDANSFEKLKNKGATADSKSNLNKNHYRKGKSGTWKEDMTAEQQFKFNSIAGKLLLDLGYEKNQSWCLHSPLNTMLIRMNIGFNEKINKFKYYAPKALKVLTQW